LYHALGILPSAEENPIFFLQVAFQIVPTAVKRAKPSDLDGQVGDLVFVFNLH
jgi:hypothetical protein